MPTATTAAASVQAAEFATFTRQLGAMLAAGVDVLRALRIAGQHSNNERLIAASRDIARRLEDGREFHQAIAPQPDLFDTFFVEMARQGEAEGQLGQALLAVADYLDRAAAPGTPDATGGGVSGMTAGVAGLTLTTLGALAVGAGLIWAIAAAELLPIAWLGPLAVLWSGACLLFGGRLLRRVRRSLPPPIVAAKTIERRAAETEAVVRGALDEAVEEREVVVPALPLAPKVPGDNGVAPSRDLSFDPDEAPRFDG